MEDILSLHPPKADHTLRYGIDPLHFGDLRLPPWKGPHPVVVVIHGGFWRAQYDLLHTGHMCAALTATGLATWNIEYRRMGNAGGGWPGTFQDLVMAAAHLRTITDEYSLDLERVVAI